MRLKPTGKTKRNPLWSKQQLLNDLVNSQLTIKDICKWYAPSPEQWRGYYNDIWKWRKFDSSFNQSIISFMKKDSNKQLQGGRPSKDGGNKSWQDLFCEELLSKNGNRAKAALVTPYSFETINQMLTPGYTEYDEKFSKKVHSTMLEIAARAEESFISSLNESNFTSIESAKIAQTKAWISKNILEKLDKDRFGNQSKITVEGNVRHELYGGKREQLLATLVEEQRRALEARGLTLPAPRQEVSVIDAKFVEVENE